MAAPILAAGQSYSAALGEYCGSEPISTVSDFFCRYV